MSRNLSKLVKFSLFTVDHKFPRLCHKMTDDELLTAYEIYAPLYWSSQATLRSKAKALPLIIAIGDELKNRYPDNTRLASWDFGQESSIINLRDLL